METRASYTVVGGFVLLMLAAIIGFVGWVASTQLRENGSIYRIYFTGSVTGLGKGSAVRYRGVPVGTVSDIRIDREHIDRIQVDVNLTEGTPVRTDTVASLEFQGITGVVYIQLSGGTQGAEARQSTDSVEPPVIPSKSSAIASLFDAAPQLIQKLGDLLDKANAVLSDDNTAAIGQLVTNLRDTTRVLSEAMPHLNALLQNVDGLTTDLNRQVPPLLASLTDTSKSANVAIRDVSGDAKKLTAALQQAADQLQALLAENKAPINQTVYEARDLLGDLRQLSGSLTRLTERIESNPRGFLFSTTDSGVKLQ